MASVAQRAKVKANIAENEKAIDSSRFGEYAAIEGHVIASAAQRAKVKANIAENEKAIDSSRFGEYAAIESHVRASVASRKQAEELRQKYRHLSDEERKALLQKKIKENTKRRKNETPIHSGVKRPPDVSIPNSIYEQIDNGGHLQCRAFYDSEGRVFARQDFTHPHYEKKASRYLMPHEHRFRYNEKGLRISKETYDVPDGYTGTPTNVLE